MWTAILTARRHTENQSTSLDKMLLVWYKNERKLVVSSNYIRYRVSLSNKGGSAVLIGVDGNFNGLRMDRRQHRKPINKLRLNVTGMV